MKFHYLLVDDLLDKGEFERRVEEKVAESGDLLDERAAAMLVVRDLGRAHIRIRDLAAAPSLACFFAKVLAVEEPREFERPDGAPGIVANVTVGDETGRARLTLWDEKAAAVSEIAVGDVLEILGRPKGRGKVPDVTAVAVQEAACEITCEETATSGGPGPAGDLEVRLIAIESPRTFTRRDGTDGEMVEAVIGNEDGVFRLVAWAPDVLLGVESGENVVIRGAVARENDGAIEYSLGESASVTPSDHEIDLPMNTIADVRDGGRYSLAGTVVSVQPPHSFVTRNGRQSSVRNLIIADPTGETPVVVWGEKADEHLVPGDRLSLYNATARQGRYGDLEVHLSWGSALVVHGEEEEIEVTGTVIATRQGAALDTGDTCYLLRDPLPVGYTVRVRGTVHRGVISPGNIKAIEPDPEDLQRRLDRFSGQPRS